MAVLELAWLTTLSSLSEAQKLCPFLQPHLAQTEDECNYVEQPQGGKWSLLWVGLLFSRRTIFVWVLELLFHVFLQGLGVKGL